MAAVSLDKYPDSFDCEECNFMKNCSVINASCRIEKSLKCLSLVYSLHTYTMFFMQVLGSKFRKMFGPTRDEVTEQRIITSLGTW